MEADRFDTLGAQVFVKGHLRQYAHLLGVDDDAIIAGYERQGHPSDEPLVGVASAPIKLRDDSQIRLMVAVGVIAVLLVALFFWWWATPIDGVSTPVRSVEPSGSSETAAPPTIRPEAIAEPAPLPQPTVAEAPDASGDAIESESLLYEASGNSGALDPIAEPISFAVEVSFSEDCWAEIFGGDDARLFYGLGRAGARSRFTATPPMTVLLGNAGGVEILINGEPYPIPVGARQGNLARFVVVDLP